MGDHTKGAEDWWPHLSIDAKHAILAGPEGPLADAVRREIEALGGEPSERLTNEDVQFIRTQIEAVD
ncbi:MAG TPA: hypothetical protein VF156_09025 [Agromyces sp.]